MEHIKKQKLEICQKTLSPLRLSNDSSFAGWTGLEHSHISPDRRSPIFTRSLSLSLYLNQAVARSRARRQH